MAKRVNNQNSHGLKNQNSHGHTNGTGNCTHRTAVDFPREAIGLQSPLSTSSPHIAPAMPPVLPAVPNVETEAAKPDDNGAAEPILDIVISNVVCSFSVRCHLNLRQIALDGCNVEYRRENAMVTMKLRHPRVTASIWSSGKITCTGSTSEEEAKVAARKVARCLQKMGFRVQFHNFRVVNVLGTCSMPFSIKIDQFSTKHRGSDCSYEPELHPGVTYKMKDLKATLKIFSTGSITVTAPAIVNVQQAIERVFPLVFEHQRERGPSEELALQLKNAKKRKKLAVTEEPLENFTNGSASDSEMEDEPEQDCSDDDDSD